MKKVLFIASYHKDRAPGQRFRFEQYFDYLRAHGYECELSYFINEKDGGIIYQKGKYLQKIRIFLFAAFVRMQNLFRKNDYAIIFIFREAYMAGTIFFEKQFHKSKAKLIFDFDDAIWKLDISEANKKFHWMKNPAKTGTIISLCDMVFAGNEFLASYARKFNSRVEIVPTTIDTNEYKRVKLPASDNITIGWSGSVTTIKHFEYSIPFLRELKKKYGTRIRIKVIGDASYRNEEFDITGIAWKRSNEVYELSEFDIGIMPLPDDEWAKGKCGLKGLQYMALEIPTVMSPVGVNTEIIQNGVNGFLASDTAEWVDSISKLIESADLREKIGKMARQTVVDRYSVNSQRDRYVHFFDELTGKR